MLIYVLEILQLKFVYFIRKESKGYKDLCVCFFFALVIVGRRPSICYHLTMSIGIKSL